MKYELPSTELIVIEENNYLKFGEYLNDMQCDDTANKLSLDDLEYVKKLQQENEILRENAKHNDKVVDKVNWDNMLLKKENNQLKCNWNNLQEFIKKSLEAIDTIQKLTGNAIENYTPKILTYKQIKDKMQELEGSDSNE